MLGGNVSPGFSAAVAVRTSAACCRSAVLAEERDRCAASTASCWFAALVASADIRCCRLSNVEAYAVSAVDTMLHASEVVSRCGTMSELIRSR